MRTLIAESIEEYDRLSRIADDLLLLARADAGQGFVDRVPVQIDAALGDVIDLFSASAEERQIALAYQSSGEVWIEGDAGRLRQVFANLLDNAIKHTPAGGAIHVHLAASDGSAEFTIADSGEGIPPEHVPRVFDRFYRADRARTRNGAGAGLGLSICRTIVEAHAGSIELTSTSGSGTTVLVRLPLRPHAPHP